MKNLCHLFIAITTVIVLPIGAAGAEVVSLTPLRDTTIFADSDDTASSAGETAFAGTTASGLPRRALFVFDFADVPTGSRVVSASFSISVDRATGGEHAMTLHRVLSDWGTGGSNGSTNGGGTLALPGDATWSHRFFGDDTRQWRDEDGVPVSGGWFATTPSATTVVGDPARYTWSSDAGAGSALVSDVQAWLDTPEANFGWILVGDESVSRSAKRFGSSEISAASLRPTLMLEIAPIPEPSTHALMIAGATLLLGFVRRRSRRS